MRYTIFGAAGAVGKALAPLLAQTKAQFRVTGRSEDRLRSELKRYEPLVEYARPIWAMPNQRQPRRVTDTLFYLVGVPYTHFELHPKLTRIALEAAASAGVRRFVRV